MAGGMAPQLDESGLMVVVERGGADMAKLPHDRSLCPVHPYDSKPISDNRIDNSRFCAACFCNVCGVKASMVRAALCVGGMPRHHVADHAACADQCTKWRGNVESAHCHARAKVGRWLRFWTCMKDPTIKRLLDAGGE